MITANDRLTYKILSASGAIPALTLDNALKSAEKGPLLFWKILSEANEEGEAGLYGILAKQTGLPLLSLKKTTIDAKAREKVPVKIAWYYKFFPYKIDEGKVWLAFSQVPDVSLLDEIRFGIGIDVMVALSPEKEIEEMLNKHYGLGADMVNKIMSQTPESVPAQHSASTHQVEDIEKNEDTASVAQLVNQIILEAYKKRASDIHLEPYRGKVRLRYRIDGVLHEAPVPADMRKFFSSILSRIKIMANLNVVEKRMPQDGKMRVKTQDQNLDLRVSSIPTAHGESMVIRILSGKNVWSLEALGFEPKNLDQIKALLQKPNGIIFATGPTGSGKSTTLYAALTALNSEDRKIITIEDPVEYELEGISQIQVASEIGLSFSQGLRSVLRHDPDVLMVGEVRDLETADISIRAALTGHLILSTLHTNDAASGITRLTDIGVEKYLIASSVIAFIAQRLVRVLCPKCKLIDIHLDPAIGQQISSSLRLSMGEKINIFVNQGCDDCNGTGFSGRQAIHEVLVMTDEIRKLIMDGAPAGEIKRHAMLKGMQSLRQDGFRKVLHGITTAEEILRTTPSDQEEKEILPLAEGEMDAVYMPFTEKESASLENSKKTEAPPAAEKAEEIFDPRRKYKRIQMHLPVTYRIIEYHSQHPNSAAMKNLFDGKDWDGDAHNISAGGLLYSSENMTMQPQRDSETAELTVSDAIESGSILELQIQLPDGERPVRCIGRVLRVQRSVKMLEIGSKFVFHIAVLFLVINSNDRTRIEKFCESTGSKK